MIGNNELVLNEATMIEALQFWLNAQMHTAPVVKGVTQDGGTRGEYCKTFVEEA